MTSALHLFEIAELFIIQCILFSVPVYRFMVFGDDLAEPLRPSPSTTWADLPPELKEKIFYHVDHGTRNNVARFVSAEFNELGYSGGPKEVMAVRTTTSVPGGLTEVEYEAFCRRMAATTKTVAVISESSGEPDEWSFADVERRMLLTNFEHLTTLLIYGKFGAWDPALLVAALRAGRLRGLVELEVLHTVGLTCQSLLEWVLPALVKISVVINGGYHDFLQARPVRYPFDAMPKLESVFISQTVDDCDWPCQQTAFLDVALTDSVRQLRVHSEYKRDTFRFSEFRRWFASVETLFVSGERLRGTAPRAAIRAFPSTTKIVATWVDDELLRSPHEVEGEAYINHVVTQLGDGWEGTNMRVRDTQSDFGKRLTSVTFVKRGGTKVLIAPCPLPRIQERLSLMP
jgi:hypothetical protein